MPDVLTLPALQTHMRARCAAFGWDTHSDERTFLLLVEEVGELAKALRRALKLQIEQNNPDKPVYDDAKIKDSLSEEFGDVLNYLLELANRFGVDLETAYRNGCARDQQRVWASA